MNASRAAEIADAVPAARGETDLLTMSGIGKQFGGAMALEDVSLALPVGTVMGIVGENGAGKSTLMKILSGVYPAGSFVGEISFRGQPARFRSVREARERGVVLIPQELHVAPGLSISENMFAGVLPSTWGVVDRDGLAGRARQWLSFFDLEFNPHLPASVLSPSEQRLMLIAGALSQEARLLILDEPTASLSDGEAQLLFRHISRLRDKGIGVLFISHRLDDIEAVSDQILVLRNGKVSARFPRRGVPRAKVVEAMIGRTGDQPVRRARDFSNAETALHVDGFSVTNTAGQVRVDDISVTVRRGEVVSLFGLVGAGRTELLRAVFGIWPGRVLGRVTVAGEEFRPRSPRHSIRAGVAFLTEDRKQTGIFAGHSLLANIDAASQRGISRFGIIQNHADRSRGADALHRLDVRARSLDQHIDHLSGGNQQKVLLARWLEIAPKVVLLDEPTVGVDVGAREEIYRRIDQLADEGLAVLIASSDLDEVLRVSDRVLVMYKGKVEAEFGSSPTRHELMSAATGGN